MQPGVSAALKQRTTGRLTAGQLAKLRQTAERKITKDLPAEEVTSIKSAQKFLKEFSGVSVPPKLASKRDQSRGPLN